MTLFMNNKTKIRESVHKNKYIFYINVEYSLFLGYAFVYE